MSSSSSGAPRCRPNLKAIFFGIFPGRSPMLWASSMRYRCNTRPDRVLEEWKSPGIAVSQRLLASHQWQPDSSNYLAARPIEWPPSPRLKLPPAPLWAGANKSIADTVYDATIDHLRGTGGGADRLAPAAAPIVSDSGREEFRRYRRSAVSVGNLFHPLHRHPMSQAS